MNLSNIDDQELPLIYIYIYIYNIEFHVKVNDLIIKISLYEHLGYIFASNMDNFFGLRLINMVKYAKLLQLQILALILCVGIVFCEELITNVDFYRQPINTFAPPVTSFPH